MGLLHITLRSAFLQTVRVLYLRGVGIGYEIRSSSGCEICLDVFVGATEISSSLQGGIETDSDYSFGCGFDCHAALDAGLVENATDCDEEEPDPHHLEAEGRRLQEVDSLTLSLASPNTEQSQKGQN